MELEENFQIDGKWWFHFWILVLILILTVVHESYLSISWWLNALAMVYEFFVMSVINWLLIDCDCYSIINDVCRYLSWFDLSHSWWLLINHRIVYLRNSMLGEGMSRMRRGLAISWDWGICYFILISITPSSSSSFSFFLVGISQIVSCSEDR